MTIRKTVLATALLGLVFACGRRVQDPGHPPQKFEFTYEEGPADRRTGMVLAGRYDGYDSEKQFRFVDTEGGQTTYKAGLSDDERNTLYEAVMRNSLLAMKTDFTNVGAESGSVRPLLVGRLQLKLDGKVTEIRFNAYYGYRESVDGDPLAFYPAGVREDWARVRRVLEVINSILKSKDEKQHLRPHNEYQ